jgi:hypothetical protein
VVTASSCWSTPSRPESATRGLRLAGVSRPERVSGVAFLSLPPVSCRSDPAP